MRKPADPIGLAQNCLSIWYNSHHMEKTIIQVGPYGVNCTILEVGGKAFVIDPGHEAKRILATAADKGLPLAGILLTHAHFDHIGALPGIAAAFPDIPICLGEKDFSVLTHPMNQFPPDYPPVAKPKNLKPATYAEELIGGLKVIETPGHTPGGVCYYFPTEKLLLSGDTLFAGSVGRTDLPGGDMPTLMASLEKLAALPDDTTVVPGHGPRTTIGAERRGNPFLAG